VTVRSSRHRLSSTDLLLPPELRIYRKPMTMVQAIAVETIAGVVSHP
jgi:hypothetical protein